MPVFRVVKNANYTTMSNYHLRDKTLSLKGKGLQSMLLSLPDEWRYSVKGLAEICLEGRGCITATLRELEKRGYLIRKQSRLPDGTLSGIEYWIYEKPQPCPENPPTDNPAAVNPVTDNPATGNPPPDSEAQIITKESSTKESNTDGDGRKPPRHRYGQYQNVLLSDEDMEKLQSEFPADWERRLERLSEYMASTGKTYRNHLATIRSWARKDASESGGRSYSHENYRFKEGDSL